MKKQIGLIILALAFYSVHAQEVNWLKYMGGTGDDLSANFAIDDDANIYLSGAFSGAVDFDFGPNEHILQSDNFVDYYIQKNDREGNFMWAKSLGIRKSQFPAITTNENNELIVETYIPNSEGLTDVRLQKFSPDGNLIFERVLDWYGYVGIYQPYKIKSEIIVIDADSSLYTINSDRDDIVVIFDDSGNTINQNYCNYDDQGFVSFGPYDETPDEFWHIGTLYGSVILEWGQSVAVGEGDFYEDIDYRVSTLLVKTDRTGNLLEAKIINKGALQDQSGQIYSFFPRILKIDSEGNFYLLGVSLGIVEYGSGNNTLTINYGLQGSSVIQKFSSSGELIWVKDIDTPESGSLSTFDITDDNDLIFSGVFSGIMDVDPNDNNEVFLQSQNPAITNLFLLKLDKDGQYIWSNAYPLNSGGVRSAENDKIIVTGIFKNDFSINTIQDGTIQVENEGFTDVYLMEVLDGPTNSSVNNTQATGCEIYPSILKNGDFIQLGCTNLKSNIHVKLFDNVGQLMEDYQNVDKEILVNNLSPGMYYIQLDNNHQRHTSKFIIVE